jgi:hypothetical protein
LRFIILPLSAGGRGNHDRRDGKSAALVIGEFLRNYSKEITSHVINHAVFLRAY